MDLRSELLKSIWYGFTALDLERSGKVSKSQLKVSGVVLDLEDGTWGMFFASLYIDWLSFYCENSFHVDSLWISEELCKLNVHKSLFMLGWMWFYASGNNGVHTLIPLKIIHISCVIFFKTTYHLTRNKCVPYISNKMHFHCWKWAQYAPLSAKSMRVTVCSQSLYEWEPSSLSCAHTGPRCTSL